MMSENSAVVALSHLRELEADRVHRQEQARRAAAEAEQAARERAEQLARAEAERRAAEEAARLHAERMAQLERERQDRLRLQEAEARARAEHDARLRQEQMRLDAQVRMTERKARPRWPLAVIPVLVLGLAGAAALGWQSQRMAERQAAEREDAEQLAALQADALAQVNAKLDDLEAQQARMQQERSELLAQISAAKDDEAMRAELEKKLAALDADIATNDRARQTKRPSKGRPTVRRPKGEPKGEPKTTAPKRPRLVLGDGNDLLDGLK